MANSIRDTLDDTQGYQINYPQPRSSRFRDAIQDRLPYLTYAGANLR